jgi:hypothetical protein
VVDSSAQDGNTRSWRTINGTTPSSGNGLELTYAFVPGTYTAYAALYTNFNSPAIPDPAGLTLPSGQTYRLIGLMFSGSESPTYDSTFVASYSTTAVRNTTCSFTNNQQNRFVIAAASVGVPPANGTDSTVSTSMTYAGRSMTSLGKVHSNNGAQGYVELFYMVDPPVGTLNVSLTASASVDLHLFGLGLYNVDQANPIGAVQTSYGSSTTASVLLSPVLARNVIFGSMISGTNISTYADGSPTGQQPPTSNDIQNFNNSSDGGCASSQLIVNPALSQTLGWTLASGPWAAIGAAINPTTYFPIGVIYGFSA